MRQRHPEAVIAAVDRLGAELRPERGAVDWTGVRRRRREAERRLRSMLTYATTRSCRRTHLLAWFGEQVRRCAGCDNCR